MSVAKITYRVYLGSKKICEFVRPVYWPFIWEPGIRIRRMYRRRVRWFEVTKITHTHYLFSVRIQVKQVSGSWETEKA